MRCGRITAGWARGLEPASSVWNYGPYRPDMVSAGSQPDWYIGWLDGSARLMPDWPIVLFGHSRIPLVFWPTAVLPLVLIGTAALYPWIERLSTKDKARHNLLQRPRDVPVRSSLGAMALTFFLVLLVSGGNDVIARVFDISLNATIWGGRMGLLEQPLADHPLHYQGAKVPRRANELGFAGSPRVGTTFRPDPPEEVERLAAARAEEAARWIRRSSPS